MRVETVNLAEKFARFTDHWSPKIAADLNDSYVKLAKFQGEFVWHDHPDEDELFLVVKGRLRIELRGQTLELGPGELVVIPKGVEHKPVAEEEVHAVLIEPKSTVNTGTAHGERTLHDLERI
ncbi:MAG TPA: cupin domain-containing protein [Candidatus Thermoplasmatota archaeon]